MSDYIYQVKDELPQSLAAINLQNITDDTLYVDSGASSQMIHNSGILTVLNTTTNQIKWLLEMDQSWTLHMLEKYLEHV